MKCVRVVGVHFDFFGNVLLLDKDAATNRMRMLHVGRRFDRDHFEVRRFIHERLLARERMKRQIHFERKPRLCYAPGHRGDQMPQFPRQYSRPNSKAAMDSAGPVSLKALRDKAVVLVDFWDYTCVNCIRTLPYVEGWNRRYRKWPGGGRSARAGIFFCARGIARQGSGGALRPRIPNRARQRIRNLARVLEQVLAGEISRRCEGTHPLLPFRRRLLPGKRSSDSGIAQRTESGREFPPPMEPVRDSDQPGAVCYRVTPELYLGHARGKFGNPEGVVRDQPHDYRDRAAHRGHALPRWPMARRAGECAQRGSGRRDFASLHGEGSKPGDGAAGGRACAWKSRSRMGSMRAPT